MNKAILMGMLTAVVALNSRAAEDYMFAMPPSDVVVAGDYAYTPVVWRVEKDKKGEVVWPDRAYLSVFDLKNAKLAGKVPLEGVPRALARSGNYLICSTGPELVVLSLAKPEVPEIVSRLPVDPHPLRAVARVRTVRDLVFCAAGRLGLLVFRLNDKGMLKKIAEFHGEDWGTATAVAVDGKRIAVTDSLGLALLTFSATGDSVKFTPQGRLILPQMSLCVALEGNLAVVGGALFELQVIDISDLTKPAHVGTYKRASNYYGVSFFDVVLKDKLAHVPLGEYAYIVVDVSNPKEPQLAMEFKPLNEGAGWTRYAMNRYYQGIYLDAAVHRVYLASERNLEVVDISDMKNPKNIAWITPEVKK